MSLISGVLLTALTLTLVISTAMLTKAIVDNLRDGDAENNVKL